MNKLAALALAALLLQCKVKLPRNDEPEAACTSSEQCPPPDGPCLLTHCMDGSCVYVPAPQGPLPAEDQRAGDCKQDYCDGNGRVFSQPASADLPPDDRNPCTEATCDMGKPLQQPKRAGEICPKGVCNASGRCAQCAPAARRCVVEGVQHCSDEGRWSAPSACPAVCYGGACIEPRSVHAGAAHACALFEDGSARCWGTRDESPKTSPWRPGTSIDTGPRHACLVEAGSVRCWGAGDFGQLGAGSYASAGTPVPVKLAGAVEVAVGDEHSCARTEQGEILCWGRNDRGQLGAGKPAPLATTTEAASPAGTLRARPVVMVAGIAALWVDGTHSCAELDKGDVRCWGATEFDVPEAPSGAELTRRKRASRAEPSKVAGLGGALRIACGAHHSCALLGDGAVRCWGAGDRGQLGTGTADSAKPVTVTGLPRASQLALGRDFACALTEGDQLFCWGANDRGQLGRGAAQARGDAQAVALGGAVRGFSVGDAFGCALVEGKGMLCWGAGAAGQLGDGKRSDARTPVPVAW